MTSFFFYRLHLGETQSAIHERVLVSLKELASKNNEDVAIVSIVSNLIAAIDALDPETGALLSAILMNPLSHVCLIPAKAEIDYLTDSGRSTSGA